MLIHFIVSWLVSAFAIWLVARIVPGIEVKDFRAALIAAAVIAVVNVTVGSILRFLTFPITFLTLGLFLLVINALLLMLAAALTPGFRVRGFLNALIGSLVLTVLTWILRAVVFA
jgi:putative membrane protein